MTTLLLSPLTTAEIHVREDRDAWIIANDVADGDAPWPPRVESFRIHRAASRQRRAS